MVCVLTRVSPRVDIFFECLLFGMFKVSRLRNINAIFVKFYKSALQFQLTFVKYTKARGNRNCAEIGLIGHFMQIFSIFKNACSIKSVYIARII